MILQNIIQDFEAIIFDGSNMADVQKFCARHGATIDFQTAPDGVTRGYLQTQNGTVDVMRGLYLGCGIDDQVFQIWPKEIGDEFPAKYKKVADEGRIGEWVHPQEPEPVVDEDDAFILPTDPDVNQRLDRLEDLITKALYSK